MLTVVSPAKSLDLDSPVTSRAVTVPGHLAEAEELVDLLVERSPAELRDLMGISNDLAELNAERYRQWSPPFDPTNARPAVLTFDGDVYRGLDAGSFTTRDFTEATKTLRILSGLYGVLRPLDLIQPYRLEMGTRLATARGRDLYEFWGSTITDALRDTVETSPGTTAVVNLASKEYFGAVRADELGCPVVSPVFLDPDRSGQLRIISFFAKRARGLMAGWMIRNRVRSPSALRRFDCDGYRFDAGRSTPSAPVFVRS